MVLLHILSRDSSGMVSRRSGALVALRSYAEKICDNVSSQLDAILVGGSPEVVGAHDCDKKARNVCRPESRGFAPLEVVG